MKTAFLAVSLLLFPIAAHAQLKMNVIHYGGQKCPLIVEAIGETLDSLDGVQVVQEEAPLNMQIVYNLFAFGPVVEIIVLKPEVGRKTLKDLVAMVYLDENPDSLYAVRKAFSGTDEANMAIQVAEFLEYEFLGELEESLPDN